MKRHASHLKLNLNLLDEKLVKMLIIDDEIGKLTEVDNF